MFAKLLGLLGLEALVRRLKAYLHDLEDRAKQIGAGAAFGIVGAVMALATFVAVLIAIFYATWSVLGTAAAVAAIVIVPAALTALFGWLAYSKLSGIAMQRPSNILDVDAATPMDTRQTTAKSGPTGAEPPHTRWMPPLGVQVSSPLELRRMLADAVGGIFGASPTTGTPVDSVIHRFTREAAASSDKTVDLAAEVVARGSRTAVFGILASTVLLGWFLARHPDAKDTRTVLKVEG